MTAYAAAPELQVMIQKSNKNVQNMDKRSVRRNRKIIRVFCALILTFVVFMAGILIGQHVSDSSSTDAASVYDREITYTTIRVAEGDTLWTIADAYMNPAYETKTEFIEEVMEINHVYDGTIHAGSYLVIPTDSSL